MPYAMFGIVEIDPSRAAEAEAMLNEQVVPSVREAPGFISGTWARSTDGTQGRSVLVFETEEAARTAAKNASEGPPPDAPVKFVSADVYEVLVRI